MTTHIPFSSAQSETNFNNAVAALGDAGIDTLTAQRIVSAIAAYAIRELADSLGKP